MNFNLPDIISWAGIISSLILGSYIIFFQWRNQSVQLLRDQVKDMGDRIKFLEDKLIIMKNENDGLKTKYEDIKFKKNYLKQIVMESLSKKQTVELSLLNEMKESKK